MLKTAMKKATKCLKSYEKSYKMLKKLQNVKKLQNSETAKKATQ